MTYSYFTRLLLIVTSLFGSASCLAESGREAWLRYAPLPAPPLLPGVVTLHGRSELLVSARDELIRGSRGMLGRILRIEPSGTPLRESALVLGTVDAVGLKVKLAPGAYRITWRTRNGQRQLLVAGGDDRGVLYGVFGLLRRLALAQPLASLDELQTPAAPLRWVNQWDNLDGTIERGYGGRSIFFDNNTVREDLTRVAEYARLLASLGINGCAINNVNANPRLITPEMLPEVARIAAAMRPWGVRVVLAVDFSSPKRAGSLETFDPLDAGVAAWWNAKVDEIYAAVPDLAGLVIKADSEGRLGPSAYGRTHADAANVIARALAPHDGLLLYRGFVYDHHMDWRNLKNDRAKAAYDNFAGLDGRFDSNVVLQIKHGPIDFQVREPASPLFGALEKTNQAIELQVTQEYFGQARHMVYLAPMWKEALDFDMHARGTGTPVKALVAGKVFSRPLGGFVGVANVGMDANWLGHPLSQANLYAYGRLAWNPDLSAARIMDEWVRLTYSHDPAVVRTISSLQMDSWRTYEKYTGPLGAQTLTDITGNHYGPAVEASERNGWGQWHRADDDGIGMDRTVRTGTGFIAQYRPAVARMYESLCPDSLLLFMHHVPYTHLLRSGKMVIQHIYDTHYEGAEAAAHYPEQWRTLAGLIDEARYEDVLERLEYQAGHAQVWRDAVNNWFLRTSKIPDRWGRAGKFPGRYEAEAAELEGYAPVEVTPWETASGARAVVCNEPGRWCSAAFGYQGQAGWHEVAVRYFDQNNGVSPFKLFVGEQLIDAWQAADRIPTRRLDGHSSTRRLIRGVALRPGDVIRVEGMREGGELAAIDYIEVR